MPILHTYINSVATLISFFFYGRASPRELLISKFIPEIHIHINFCIGDINYEEGQEYCKFSSLFEILSTNPHSYLFQLLHHGVRKLQP